MQSPISARSLPHLHAPRALDFRVEAEVPESKRHLLLRTLLFRLLRHAYADRACIGSDQFVYWNAANPARCLAPDAFVRFGSPDEDFDTWKTWERGAPQLCVEVTSRSDRADPDWEEKLASYRELGVLELVRFDPPTGRLRIWDRLDDDLVERGIDGERSPCAVAGATWVVVSDEGKPALRLASDAAGLHLLPTPEESEARAREAAERRAALGKAEGKSEGRAEGKAEGRAEGKAEGRAEGKAEGRGESLLNVLRLRDLPFDAATEARIRETRDSELLDRWLARALLAASVDEVLAD